MNQYTPQYYEDHKRRFELKFKYEIEPRLDEIQQWLDNGLPIREIIRRLHTSNQTLLAYRYIYPEFDRMFKTAIEQRKANDIRCKKFTYTSKPRETLCWRCNNIVPNLNKGKGCEWSLYDKPVPGWEAERTELLVSQGRKVHSYCVYSCPKFKRLERGNKDV